MNNLEKQMQQEMEGFNTAMNAKDHLDEIDMQIIHEGLKASSAVPISYHPTNQDQAVQEISNFKLIKDSIPQEADQSRVVNKLDFAQGNVENHEADIDTDSPTAQKMPHARYSSM